MSETTTKEKAEAALDSALESGVAISEGNLSVTRAGVNDAIRAIDHEEKKAAERTGRRPLFRGINLGGMGY